MKRLSGILIVGCIGATAVIQSPAAQYVELTAEMKTTYWPRDAGPAGEITSSTRTARCIVGQDAWLLEGDFLLNSFVTWHFTGTNLLQKSVVIRPTPDETINRVTQSGSIAMTFPQVGQAFSTVHGSVDGNPGKPPRVMDLLITPAARTLWMAFCSGPALKRPGRRIYPPSDLWKQFIDETAFEDLTSVFDDDLGLPRSVDLLTSNHQAVLQYRASGSTNVFGWTFPLAFHLAQYFPTSAQGWVLHMTTEGKLTSIGVSSKPGTAQQTTQFKTEAG